MQGGVKTTMMLMTFTFDIGNNGNDAVDGNVDIAGIANARGRRGQRVRQHHDGHNNDAEIEYGYQRSQWRTSYKKRGSSFLTPA